MRVNVEESGPGDPNSNPELANIPMKGRNPFILTQFNQFNLGMVTVLGEDKLRIQSRLREEWAPPDYSWSRHTTSIVAGRVPVV